MEPDHPPFDERCAEIPGPSERRMAVRVTKDALRHVRRGHPWIYDESITSISHEGAPGDLAVVFDDQRKFAAIGLFDPDSPIRIKVLHAGKPATIDASWWRSQLERAATVRRGLAADPATTGWRMVSGENDGLPGLVVDRYDTTLVVKLYTSAWFPHLVPIIEALLRHAMVDEAMVDGAPAVERVVLRLARRVADGPTFDLVDGDILVGAETDEVVFAENGLRFISQPVGGQKTGFFLDQRDNRALVRARTEDASVLDVFCATGGFSVAAAAGGARRVTSVDIAPKAIETTGRAIDLNRQRFSLTDDVWEGIVGDAFEVMNRLIRAKKQFDLVVIDPPSFAQRQSSVAGGLRAYARLTELAIDLVEDGGTLLQASCSSRITSDQFYEILHRTARTKDASLVEIERTAHAIDHPIGFPEGAYLKALLATVRRSR